MAFGIGLQLETRLADQAFFTDAGQHVLQGATFAVVIEHVVGGDGWCLVLPCDACGLGQPGPVLPIITAGEGEIERVFEAGFDLGQLSGMGLRQGEDQAFGVVADVFKGDVAFAFPGPSLTQCQQAAETAIGAACGGIGEEGDW